MLVAFKGRRRKWFEVAPVEIAFSSLIDVRLGAGKVHLKICFETVARVGRKAVLCGLFNRWLIRFLLEPFLLKVRPSHWTESVMISFVNVSEDARVCIYSDAVPKIEHLLQNEVKGKGTLKSWHHHAKKGVSHFLGLIVVSLIWMSFIVGKWTIVSCQLPTESCSWRETNMRLAIHQEILKCQLCQLAFVVNSAGVRMMDGRRALNARKTWQHQEIYVFKTSSEEKHVLWIFDH